jgi:hypothetical protein
MKLILKILSDLKPLRDASNKKKRCIQLVRVLIRLFMALAGLKTSKSVLCPRLFFAPPRLENPDSDFLGLATRITIFLLCLRTNAITILFCVS